MAGGSVATLAILAIVPVRVGSETIASSNCQEVVKSGAEISRGQLSSLLAIPEGTLREAVRQVVDVPYCVLPAMLPAAAHEKSHTWQSVRHKKDTPSADMIEREAYPLAFDPGTWVVVNYTRDQYIGYGFVFKP